MLDEIAAEQMAKDPANYVPRHAEVPFVPEGPTRRDIKEARSKEEIRDLNVASKIVRRMLGGVAVPAIGTEKPLEPIMQRGTYSDEAVRIATERLHKPYGLDVVVEEQVQSAETPYDEQYEPGAGVRPHRVIRVAGINDHANHTPTSHRK